jgi:hypothetical protein
MYGVVELVLVSLATQSSGTHAREQPEPAFLILAPQGYSFSIECGYSVATTYNYFVLTNLQNMSAGAWSSAIPCTRLFDEFASSGDRSASFATS